MTNICRWLFLLYFLSTWAIITNSKEIRVVCYYTNWSVYRPGTAKFSPQNINPYLCTHLVYAFGGFTKENTLKPFDKYQDIEKGGYAKFTGLKTYNKNLKTLLAIGGWNEGSSRFSPMVANADRRKELVKNAIKFLRQNHFDGLDLDWEYPSFRDGGKPRDKDNYALLVQELREEFEKESEKTGRPRLLLTMAVPAGIEYINKGYDVPKLTKYLDWMNILSYDYHSAFEPAVNHHAPLYSLEEDSEYNYDVDLNIDHTIKHYLKQGADPNKLVVGIPTYGRSYTLFNPDANDIGAPADGPGDMGEATRENGYLAYYEICDYVKNQGWEVVQPNPEAMGPYAFKGNQWVGYDDQAIARKKAEYVIENGLGGIMFWSIDNDDFRGNCHGKPYPIIEAAKEALIQAAGLTDENLVAPKKPTKTKTRSRTRPKTTTTTTTVASVERKKHRRRNRVDGTKTTRKEVKASESSTYSSLKVITPAYTTPEPPTTPDGGGAFKCEDEGFFPHPKDCKKYFWCLSGPGESGIIAHQFTCPAGLYFNKAADSCDYTQNVLCNKKIQKATATTTTTTTTAAPITTTKSKILSSSRSSLFRTTTTTIAPIEEEYEEYEDEEEEEEHHEKNAEEDPRVIKELLDLIKKAGGIEELEKQLKLQESGKSNNNFNKNLVQKVLNTRKSLTSGQKSTLPSRNSRGPQNEGIEKDTSKDKSKPKYITIARDKAKSKIEAEVEEESQDKKTSNNKLEYVNIRRGRVSTTTEAEVESKRNKLGEEIEDEEYEDDVETTTTRKAITTPQYVNIRRQRPSTTEGTTSKYTVIRRGSTTEAPPNEEDSHKRGISNSTTSLPEEEAKTRGTTTKSPPSDEQTKYKTIRRGTTSTTTESPDLRSTTLDDLISRLTTLVTGSSSSTTPEGVTTQIPVIISSTQRTLINLDTTEGDLIKTKPPQLLEPRPFSITTQTTSLRPITETTTVKVTKVSEPNSIRTRRPSRFSFSTTEQQQQRTTTNPSSTQRSRKRFTTTTESSLSFEDLDLNRTFRPSGIADLSSLTAVDLGAVKGTNRFGINSRRRIISTTHKPKIIRKPITINDLSDQVESGSDVTNSVSSTEKPSFRNRKIIRRLRPTPARAETTSVRTKGTTDNVRGDESSSVSPLFRRKISRFSTTTSTPDNVKSVTVSPIQYRRFTKSTKPDSTTEKLVTPEEELEKDSDNETLEEINTEDGENIKLSESNIRENNDVSTSNRISSEDGKKIRTKVLKRVKNVDLPFEEIEKDVAPKIRFNFNDKLAVNEKPTEPNIVIRSRKIIRKLTTESTSSTTESVDITSGRKRKIIRRLRPTLASKINKLDDEKETKKFKQTSKVLFRPRTSTSSSLEEELSSSTQFTTEQSKTFTENNKSSTLENAEDELNESTTLNNKENEDNTTPSVTEDGEEAGITTLTPTTEGKSTTPYINRILEKQKNRPTFIRPKLTTSSAVSSTTARSRFRGTRFTTARPTERSTKPLSRRFTTPRSRVRSTLSTTSSSASPVEVSVSTTATSEYVTTSSPIETSTSERSIEISTTGIIQNSTPSENEEATTPDIISDNEILEKTTRQNPSASTTELLTKIQTSTEEIDMTVPTIADTTTVEHFYDTTRLLNEMVTATTPRTDEISENSDTKMPDQIISTLPSFIITQTTTVKSITPSTTEALETSTSQALETSSTSNKTIENEFETSTEIEVTTDVTPRSRLIFKGRTTEKPEQETEKSTTPRRLSYRERNKLKIAESNKENKEENVDEVTQSTPKKRFGFRGRTTEKNIENENAAVPVARNKFILKGRSTTEKPVSVPILRNRFNFKNPSKNDDENEEETVPDDVKEDEELDKTKSRPTFKQKPRQGFQSRRNKTTESPKDEIDVEILKARNKNLYSNKRKMNTPFVGIKPETSTQVTTEKEKITTTVKPEETTEYLSTLLHIFAEVETEPTTPSIETKSKSKVERLIEVSRIIEVHNKDNNSKEEQKLVDKIGAISRITSINIVDPKENEIANHTNDNVLELATIHEQTNNERHERKYEIYGNSKVSDAKGVNDNGKAEIIDGLSHINIITPRPYFSTEASTIALEGLFRTTTTATTKTQQDDELLETDNSKFVNVRVLEQNDNNNGRNFGIRDNTKIIPIKVLPQDEYITMKAKVVEVTPSSKDEIIKIVPIKVEMSRKLIN